MEKAIGQPKKVKTKSGRVGSFFLGWFVGFLLTIALLVGAGCFVYFKLSVNWVNKTFKTDINLPYGLNSLTINDTVKGAINLSKNLDAYTLEDLKKDFGVDIPDKIFKIDVSDLKKVSFKQISAKISEKFENISAKELEELITFPSSIDGYLKEQAVEYYADGTTLYEDSAHSIPVTFAYEIVGTEVHIKNFHTEPINYAPQIVDGKVSILREYLPIKIAFSGLETSGNMTLAELRSLGFDIQLLSDIPGDTHLNELEGAIEDIQIAKLLNYDVVGGKVYKSSTHTPENEASKLESFIALKTIGQLKSGKGLELTLGNIFEDSYFEQGNILAILANEKDTTSIDKIPELLNEKLANANLQTLKDVGIIKDVDLDVEVSFGGGAKKKLGEYKLDEFINAALLLATKS